MFDVVEKISNDLDIPREILLNALEKSSSKVRKIRFKQRSGKVRTAFQPAAELKPIQEWLNIIVFSKLPVSEISTAFEMGSSILKNAYKHRGFSYSVRVDIENFFPSICFSDFSCLLKKNSSVFDDWVSSSSALDVVKKACFDKSERLPIGYSTSPKIANAVMYELDNSVFRSISSDVGRFGRFALTRYADDFVFSTDKKEGCSAFVEEIRRLFDFFDSPKFELNSSKTKYMCRRAGSTFITGLRIKPDGRIGVHAKYRDHVRLLLKHYALGVLKEDDVVKLLGHLAFVENADPSLFTRLSFRYADAIAKIRGS